jgi:uncharacterized phage-associated protein
MADVLDVAEQILQVKGPIDTFSLQKLVYYSHAYHLAKHEKPLFSETIEAWSNGPAVPSLFQKHRGNYRVNTVNGDPSHLSTDEAESVAMALRFYGNHGGAWLVTQSHTEPPWIDARQGLEPTDRGSNPITDEAILKYFYLIFNDPEVDAALASVDSDVGITVEEFRARYQK